MIKNAVYFTNLSEYLLKNHLQYPGTIQVRTNQNKQSTLGKAEKLRQTSIKRLNSYKEAHEKPKKLRIKKGGIVANHQ